MIMKGITSNLKTTFLLMALALGSGAAYGQSTNDYRSAGSGNWSELTTWQRYNNAGQWVTPTAGQGPATNGKGNISIRTGHTVTVDAFFRIDQATIEAGASVVVGAGDTLRVADDPGGTDLTVLGELVNAGTITQVGTATISFNAGSIYTHQADGGRVPEASWDMASTCEITGIQGASATSLDQIFGNLSWNCTGQTTNQSLPDAGSMQITGNFVLENSGGGTIQLNQSSLSIGGNYMQSGGTLRVASGNINRALAIGGNLMLSGGTFRLSQGGGTGVGTIGLAGNFSISGGMITETNSGMGSGLIELNGSGTQVFSAAGNVTNTINFQVNPNAILHFASPSDFVSGGGAFTLSPGATLGITAPEGLTSTPGMGNIRVTGSRTYSTTATYRYLGPGAQATGNELPAAVSNLTVNTAGGLTLSQALSVTGTLTLSNGVLNATETNLLTLADNATVSGGSAASYVAGVMDKTGNDAFTFPVGGGGFYAPVGISAPGADTDVFRVEYVRSGAENENSLEMGVVLVSSLEYWNITRRVGMSDVFLSLSWSNGSGVEEPGDLLLCHFNGMVWESIPATAVGAPGAGVITTDVAVSSFSPFTLGSNSPLNPLPVSWLSFEGKPAGGQVALHWATASERNNRGFVVEHSADGQRFERVGWADGQGDSAQPAHYHWLHARPARGLNYYRLRQEDFGGAHAYSATVAVSIEAEGEAVIYPVPAVEKAWLSLAAPLAADARAALIDATGRVCRHFVLSAGQTTLELDLSGLSAGRYHLQLPSGQGHWLVVGR